MKNEDTESKTLDATSAQNNETATGVTEERKKRMRIPRIWESNAEAVTKIVQRDGDDHDGYLTRNVKFVLLCVLCL